jgi:hypothetical protein
MSWYLSLGINFPFDGVPKEPLNCVQLLWSPNISGKDKKYFSKASPILGLTTTSCRLDNQHYCGDHY